MRDRINRGRPTQRPEHNPRNGDGERKQNPRLREPKRTTFENSPERSSNKNGLPGAKQKPAHRVYRKTVQILDRECDHEKPRGSSNTPAPDDFRQYNGRTAKDKAKSADDRRAIHALGSSAASVELCVLC